MGALGGVTEANRTTTNQSPVIQSGHLHDRDASKCCRAKELIPTNAHSKVDSGLFGLNEWL